MFCSVVMSRDAKLKPDNIIHLAVESKIVDIAVTQQI